MTTLNKEALATLCNSNETAKALFSDFAERRRMRWVSNLGQYATKLVNKGVKVVEADYMAAWKSLESMGAGSIIHGRNGNPDRFKWHYSLKDVGVGALNPTAIGDITEPVTPVAQAPKRSPKKAVRRGRPKGFNRSAHMKRMWREGRISGRKALSGKRSPGRPKKTTVDAKQVLKQIGKLLAQLS